MNDEDETFHMDCFVCETKSEVTVLNSDEQPFFCPMCGTEME
jgi:predicted RNA-binding Zn-ribbon protein involved in translation (DUF1610 family)